MAPRLTNQQKIAIYKYEAEHPSISQPALAGWAKEEFRLESVITESAISKILKNRQIYEEFSGDALHRKRPRMVKFPELEDALSAWVLQCQERSIAITGDLIRTEGRRLLKDLDIAEDAIDFSNGWLQKFQRRQKLRSLTL